MIIIGLIILSPIILILTVSIWWFLDYLKFEKEKKERIREGDYVNLLCSLLVDKNDHLKVTSVWIDSYYLYSATTGNEYQLTKKDNGEYRLYQLHSNKYENITENSVVFYKVRRK